MKRPLLYWQKIYLAALALFLGGLCAGFFGVFQFSCRQSFAARPLSAIVCDYLV